MRFTDGFEQDRIGWREITATGDGVRLTGSSVPGTSISQELRAYPDDLLSAPLDQRVATFTATEPGLGPSDGQAAPPEAGRPAGAGSASSSAARSARRCPPWTGRSRS
ncbi:hypothetical protein ACFQQB_35540 [Nonomuraea rubra]|uniref:hypothetical protein n=1 Tax=Nonomuraea rubra TaxID=46180 RepID=UPI003612FA77